MNAALTRCVRALLLMLGLFASFNGQGNGANEILPADLMKELSVRTHETWEGTYGYSGVSVIRTEKLRDLYAITYRCKGHEGMLLDFAILEDNGALRFLYDAHEDVKGVTPALEGIDVFPHDQAAEIIVRWRHPGQGGLRTVQKYLYRETTLTLVDQSDFVADGRAMKWVRSTP